VTRVRFLWPVDHRHSHTMSPTMANKPATIPRVTAVSHSIVSLDPTNGTKWILRDRAAIVWQLTAFELNCPRSVTRLRPPDAAPDRCGKARPRPACQPGRRVILKLHTDAGTLYRVGNPVAAASFVEIADAAEREYLRRSPIAPSCQLG
jgi:hypothetical protein